MAKRKLNPALTKPLTPTAALAEVVGKKPLARSAAIKAV
jgi:chromatin remodeling complex protein RSC6